MKRQPEYAGRLWTGRQSIEKSEYLCVWFVRTDKMRRKSITPNVSEPSLGPATRKA